MNPDERLAAPIPSSRGAEGQRLVDRHFEKEAGYWTEVYGQSGGWAQLVRDRQAIALRWVDRLELVSRAPVLEVGSGAGFLSVNLARRDLSVVAVDSVARMVELTRLHALQAGVGEQVTARVADVQRLEFPDRAFHLVVALGVIEWIPEPARAVTEMARVLYPGGWMIVSSGNRSALPYLLEPLKNPWLAPVKQTAKALLQRAGVREPMASPKLTSRKWLDRLVSAAGLIKVDCRTVGFGPLTVLRRALLPDPVGQRAHERLQALADRGLPLVRSAGMEYVVLARRD